jgi:hypothetical protein
MQPVEITYKFLVFAHAQGIRVQRLENTAQMGTKIGVGGRIRENSLINSLFYPVYAMTRKSLGEMTRKLSVIRSRNRFQFLGMVRRRNVMIASRNSARVS